MLWEEQSILGIGQKGEETYGRRHFMELLSVFLSPPMFAVLHGRQELGFVDELTFLGKQDGARVLLLGGRAWHVTHIDWQRKIAHVEASEDRGRTRWKGAGQGLSFRLSHAIKAVLVEDETRPWWSQRAQDRLRELREEYAWLRPEGSVVVVNPDNGIEWWTFAGHRANASLATAMAQMAQSQTSSDSLTVRFEKNVSFDDIERAIQQLRASDVADILPAIDEAAIEGLKFSACLPLGLALQVLQARTRDPIAVAHALREPVRFVLR
jgi:ATP-dependent Lhr-like helicase